LRIVHSAAAGSRFRWRRSPIVAAGAALVLTLLGAELAVRVIEPALPEPRLYADDTTHLKILQMDRQGCADVVVAGDSMGRDAFDPVRFTAADPTHRRAYNASLDAASPELLRPWLLDEVVPRLDPSLVVITLASLDLDANGAAARGALAAYEQADMTGTGPVHAVARRLVTTSALFRSRRELRDPLVLATAVGRRWAGTGADRLSADELAEVVGPGGEGRSRRALTYRHDPTTRSFTGQQLLGHWALDAAQVHALDELLAALAGRGVAVALVVLPVTADYVALHPRGAADAAAFRSAVHAAAGTAGAPLVDLLDERPAGLPDDGAFADTHHLNITGQEWFSATLPARLAPMTARSRCG
jgi:hypothetical protein